MGRLTIAETQFLYDQLYNDRNDKIEFTPQNREIGVGFCRELCVPDSINFVVMHAPRISIESLTLTVSTEHIRCESFTARDIIDELCDHVEECIAEYYFNHGEVCYFGLYCLPWTYQGDPRWWIRYALGHRDRSELERSK